MRVRDLRRRLRQLLDETPNSDVADSQLKALSTILADLDDMSIEAFFKRLLKKPRTSSPTPKVAIDVSQIVSRLKSALADDDTFHSEIDKLTAQKSVTKPVLTKVFYELFERKGGVPSKATRADLLRLIEDERNILVRNNKMGQMLGRRPVPAE